MQNLAPYLALLFLAITFLQSGYDKMFNWKDNVDWLKSHFKETILKNQVPASLGIVLVMEVFAGILCVVGCFDMYFNSSNKIGYYGAVLSCVTLLFLLFGQRLAKDYDGARTIAIYFIIALFAVFLLS